MSVKQMSAEGFCALLGIVGVKMPGKGSSKNQFQATFYVFCIVSLFVHQPWTYADQFNTETSSSVRSLGMGGVGINTELGPNSVHYNPANIAAKKTGVSFQLVNFILEGNDTSAQLMGDANYTNFTNLASVYEEGKKHPGQFIGGRYSLYPNFTIRNFSVGLLYEKSEGAMYEGKTGELLIRARDRFAPTGAVSFRLMNGILRLGASAQLLTVGESTEVIRRPEALGDSLEYSEYINAGSGLVFNGGGTITLPMRNLPSFSVVIRNITNTKLTSTPFIKFGDKREVSDYPFLIDLGSSVRVHMSGRLVFKLEANYKDFTNEYDGNLMRHVFLGGEFDFFDTIQFRLGYQHGWMTAGFGLKAGYGTLDFAWYSDEIANRYKDHRDQRFALQYSYSLFGTEK